MDIHICIEQASGFSQKINNWFKRYALSNGCFMFTRNREITVLDISEQHKLKHFYSI